MITVSPTPLLYRSQVPVTLDQKVHKFWFLYELSEDATRFRVPTARQICTALPEYLTTGKMPTDRELITQKLPANGGSTGKDSEVTPSEILWWRQVIALLRRGHHLDIRDNSENRYREAQSENLKMRSGTPKLKQSQIDALDGDCRNAYRCLTFLGPGVLASGKFIKKYHFSNWRTINTPFLKKIKAAFTAQHRTPNNHHTAVFNAQVLDLIVGILRAEEPQKNFTGFLVPRLG
ncbi:hypothetical protein HKX48_002527 [Thoreauomyces humboldtii]|nr:hypothetical protein HKX48_002527 [Thoreauomyces humboldtii]